MTMYDPLIENNSDHLPPPIRHIRFAAIGEAWTLMKAQYGNWVLIGLIYLTLIVSISLGLQGILYLCGISMASTQSPFSPIPDLKPHHVLSIIVSNLIKLPLNAFLSAGIYRIAVKQVRGESVEVRDLFSGGNVFGAMLMAAFLEFVFIYGCSLYIYFPGYLFTGIFYLVFPIIVDQRVSAIEAVKMSWSALKGQPVASFFLSLLAVLVGVSGALGCGVGLLFTFPLIYLIQAIVYRDFYLTTPLPGMPSTLPTAPIQIEMPFPPQSLDIPSPTDDSNDMPHSH